MLVPASAGVILEAQEASEAAHTCPRIRGGDPVRLMVWLMAESLSPHPRG